MTTIEEYSKWKNIDSALNALPDGGSLDLVAAFQTDASYPRQVVGVLANRDKDGAATFSLRCRTQGGNNTLNLRFTVGETHIIPVRTIYKVGTGGRELHVFGI